MNFPKNNFKKENERKNCIKQKCGFNIWTKLPVQLLFWTLQEILHPNKCKQLRSPRHWMALPRQNLKRNRNDNLKVFQFNNYFQDQGKMCFHISKASISFADIRLLLQQKLKEVISFQRIICPTISIQVSMLRSARKASPQKNKEKQQILNYHLSPVYKFLECTENELHKINRKTENDKKRRSQTFVAITISIQVIQLCYG